MITPEERERYLVLLDRVAKDYEIDAEGDVITEQHPERIHDKVTTAAALRKLIAALTREPAPAASSEFELSAFGKALVAGGTLEDAFAAEGVRLDAAPAPAPCPHRELELEREALKATLEAALRWTRGSRTGWSRSYLTAQLEARIAALASAQPCAPAACQHLELMREIDSFYSPISRMWAGQEPEDEFDVTHAQLVAKVRAALASAQPCAAPGEAGEWSESGLVTHKFKAHYDVAGTCGELLSNIAQDGDYIRVYEPRYRRRAPEAKR